MSAPRGPAVSRRGVLAGGGALVLHFSLQGAAAAQQAHEAQNAGAVPPTAVPLPGSLDKTPMLDSWIRVEADGAITVFTGKAELGQGIKTALIQIAAEQLDVAPHTVHLVTADTAMTPNEGYTAGSHSMQDSGTAIMNAAAQVREILLGIAANRWSLSSDQIFAHEGAALTKDGRRLGFGELVSDEVLHVRAAPTSKLKDPATHRVMGTAMPRVDIPAKVTGGAAYVHDLRLPGMVHARVVRPPSYGARLREIDSSSVERMPGVLKVIRDGNYLAVVAEREFQAIKAMQALAGLAHWDESAKLPDQQQVFSALEALPAEEHVILNKPAPAVAGARTIEMSFRRRYQMHGSIGPSCAVAEYRDGVLTVYSHAQGMFPLRQSIAELLHLAPDQVRCIHTEGSGCYGHNGADDAAADAALIAFALPGRPVRVQWMREQEHQWEPYGPAMITRAKAALDTSGKIVDWQYEVRSNTHSTRPPGAGQFMPAWFLSTPFKPSAPKPLPQPEGGGDRNAIPLYVFPSARVIHRFVPDMPLRVSALRGLGAYMNVFSIESFMDELAIAAGLDPIEIRLRHLEDSRAIDVIKRAAETFGWSAQPKQPGSGHGFAFARYKNLGAYAAIAVEVDVQADTGRVRVVRAVAAVDSGEAVNPDGIRNQIEGGIIQSSSWTLYEAVTFDSSRITSRDWSTYPIVGFGAVPDSIEVHVVDRPGEPFLGTGEAAQGPAAAAIANAVRNATGIRMRELPITPERLRAEFGV